MELDERLKSKVELVAGEVSNEQQEGDESPSKSPFVTSSELTELIESDSVKSDPAMALTPWKGRFANAGKELPESPHWEALAASIAVGLIKGGAVCIAALTLCCAIAMAMGGPDRFVSFAVVGGWVLFYYFFGVRLFQIVTLFKPATPLGKVGQSLRFTAAALLANTLLGSIFKVIFIVFGILISWEILFLSVVLFVLTTFFFGYLFLWLARRAAQHGSTLIASKACLIGVVVGACIGADNVWNSFGGIAFLKSFSITTVIWVLGIFIAMSFFSNIEKNMRIEKSKQN